MATKAKLVLKGRDNNNVDMSQTISNINPDLAFSSDASVVQTFKQDCVAFARALNSLTTNSLLTVTLETSEDITGVA